MTLSDLAALAAKVEGFERPKKTCQQCGGMGWCGAMCCKPCEDTGRVPDDSPSVLAMAVMVCVAKGRDVACLSAYRAIVTREDGPGPSYSGYRAIVEPEDIARALLTALLRAHGVEVPNA